jgi:hypothetical protein
VNAVGATHKVAFTGGRRGSGPLTWGQRWMWEEAHWFGDEHAHLNMSLVMDVPRRCSLSEVLTAVRTMVQLHESLRTRFVPAADGTPRQVVAASGDLAVQVVDGPEDPVSEQIRCLEHQLWQPSFRPDDLPLRVGVVARGGSPLALVLIVFHLAADGWAVAQLREQLNQLLRGEPPDNLDIGIQPLDQAEYERGPGGRARATKSLGYWRRHLRDFPAPALPVRTPEPEVVRYREMYMESAALTIAARTLSQRHSVGVPTILLAVSVTLLGVLSGSRTYPVMLYCSNRIGAYSGAALGTFVQDVPIAVDLSGDTFADVVADAWSSSVSAYRYGEYDVVSMDHLLHGVAGRSNRPCAVNLAFGGPFSGTEASRTAPDSPEQAILRELPGTVIMRYRELEKDRKGRKLYLKAFDLPRATGITLRADTSVLSSQSMRCFLRDFERIVVEAVRDPALCYEKVAELLGQTPYGRGGSVGSNHGDAGDRGAPPAQGLHHNGA